MNFKKSPFSIQDKTARNLVNSKDYPTLADLMREQKVTIVKIDSLEKECE